MEKHGTSQPFSLQFLRTTDVKIPPLGLGTWAQGLLTGKYRPGIKPAGLRGLRTNTQRLRRIQPLLAAMERIGKAHGGRTLPQVALNLVMAKGAVPIPGAKN